MTLEGHRVLITGGSAGIGLALAEDFLAAGCRVAICGRDPQRLASAEQALPASLTATLTARPSSPTVANHPPSCRPLTSSDPSAASMEKCSGPS